MPMRPDSAVAPFRVVCLQRKVPERTAWKPESRPEAAHMPNQDVAKQRGCHRQGKAETRAIGEYLRLSVEIDISRLKEDV